MQKGSHDELLHQILAPTKPARSLFAELEGDLVFVRSPEKVEPV
jgi:hypothetical protein